MFKGGGVLDPGMDRSAILSIQERAALANDIYVHDRVIEDIKDRFMDELPRDLDALETFDPHLLQLFLAVIENHLGVIVVDDDGNWE